MDDLNVGKVRKGTRLIDIPVELRLEIFRHLLHAEYVYKPAPFPQMKLDTAILGVSRRVRSEASKVLYEENQWILVKGNWIGGDYGKYMQECGLPIICHGAAMHIQNAALLIDIKLNRDNGDPGTLETTAIAYSEESLDELCRTFWQDALKCKMDITVTLTEQSDKLRSVPHKRLLAPFSRVRGVQNAVIQGASSQAQAEALKKVMEDGDWTWPQIIDRLTNDKEEGNARFKLRSYLKAEISYLRAIVFKSEIADFIIHKHHLNRHIFWMNRLAGTVCEIYNRHSLVALKLGKADCAIRSANDALLFPGITDNERARAHYRRGLGYASLRNDIEAGKDFYYALDLYPADKFVKQQLDAVEDRLGRKITEDIAPLRTVVFEGGWLDQWKGDARLLQVWGPHKVARIPMYGIMAAV